MAMGRGDAFEGPSTHNQRTGRHAANGRVRHRCVVTRMFARTHVSKPCRPNEAFQSLPCSTASSGWRHESAGREFPHASVPHSMRGAAACHQQERLDACCVTYRGMGSLCQNNTQWWWHFPEGVLAATQRDAWQKFRCCLRRVAVHPAALLLVADAGRGWS